MEDYNRVLEATSVAENANGVAAEKMTVYNESLEAAQNRLTASVQQFAQDSNLDRTLALAYDGLSKVVEILNILLNKIPVLSPLIKALGVALATAFAGAIIKNMISTSEILKGIVSAAPGVVSAFANMATGAGTFGAVVEAAGGPLTIILGLLAAFIAIAPSVASWWQKMFPSTEKKAEDAKSALEESNTALEETNSKIKEIQDKITEIDSKDNITLTDQAEKERLDKRSKELTIIIASCDKILAEIKAYKRAKIELVESNVNKYFDLVRWKFYAQNITNDDEQEICTCIVGGKDFVNLNDAMKINAQIDICNAIARTDDIFAPMWIDGAESVTEPLGSLSQQFLLKVVDNEKFNISL